MAGPYLWEALARHRELQGGDQVCDMLPGHRVLTLVAMQVGEDAVTGRDGALGGKGGLVMAAPCTSAADVTELSDVFYRASCQRCTGF